MNKIFILRNSNPEELERQYHKWAEDKEIIKIHYQINTLEERKTKYQQGTYITHITYYSILVEYNNEIKCDCEQ
jgi:hypothetical protein